jgi:outer membrane protein TolC
VDAERAYEMLTGLYARPTNFAEALTGRSDFDETHPLLRMADAEIARARAQADLTSAEGRGNPVLTIGPRRQRDPLGTSYTDSIGVQVSGPFGGQAHAAPATAAAVRRVAEAEARRVATLRELDAAVHEALHTLEVAEDGLALAEERAALAERYWRMGRTAFEQGEISLTELLRREEAERIAAREAARLGILRGRTIAEVNQAIGELP